MLAQNGVLGPLNVMEQDVLYDFDEFERRFTPDFYHVAQELQLKPWLGSRTSTGCIQLVLELVDDHQIAVEEIREVVVNAHRFYQNPPFGIVHPKSYFEGCFSVPWIVANALLGHQPGPDWVVPEAFLDERRQSMAGKVTVGEHPEAVAMWATGKALGNPDVPLGVEIKTNRGVLTKEMRYWQILGSPRNPMSQAQLDAKFLRLASRVIGAEKAHRLLAKTKRWHKIENVREISSLY
jgi:2-methylcitrate dehydratase PrpD